MISAKINCQSGLNLIEAVLDQLIAQGKLSQNRQGISQRGSNLVEEIVAKTLENRVKHCDIRRGGQV